MRKGSFVRGAAISVAVLAVWVACIPGMAYRMRSGGCCPLGCESCGEHRSAPPEKDAISPAGSNCDRGFCPSTTSAGQSSEAESRK